MGYLLKAECASCHWHHDNFVFGSGFVNRIPKLPALHKETSAFVVTEDANDPDLDYYHSPHMHKRPVEGFGIQNNDIRLNPHRNKCPACGEFEMAFEVLGEWD